MIPIFTSFLLQTKQAFEVKLSIPFIKQVYYTYTSSPFRSYLCVDWYFTISLAYLVRYHLNTVSYLLILK